MRLLESPLLDEGDSGAIINLDNALTSDAETISERMEENEDERMSTLEDADSMMDALMDNLDKLEKIRVSSDLVVRSSSMEDTQRRIEEIQSIKELLEGEDKTKEINGTDERIDAFISDYVKKSGSDININEAENNSQRRFVGGFDPNYSREPKKVQLNAKLVDKARNFFETFLSTEAVDENNENAIDKPINQILDDTIRKIDYKGSVEPLHKQFENLSDIPVKKLSRENLDSIIAIAIQNLKSQYRDRVDASKLLNIKDRIAFISDKQVQKEMGKDYSPGICGYYTPYSDSIRINMEGNATVGDILATIDHEVMHLISQNAKGEGGVLNSDIIYDNVGMNEGITEMLSIKNMRDVNPDYNSNAYKDEVEIMEIFSCISGKKQLLDFYFQKDLISIPSDFNSCMGSKKAFEKFCNDLDLLYHYNYIDPKAKEAPFERKEIKDRIYRKLEKYRQAKLSGAKYDIINSSLEKDQSTKDTGESLNAQLRFGIGKERKSRNNSIVSVETSENTTMKEKHRVFAEGLRADYSLERQAEDAAKRNANNPVSSNNDEDPNKEEHERSIFYGEDR